MSLRRSIDTDTGASVRSAALGASRRRSSPTASSRPLSATYITRWPSISCGIVTDIPSSSSDNARNRTPSISSSVSLSPLSSTASSTNPSRNAANSATLSLSPGASTTAKRPWNFSFSRSRSPANVKVSRPSAAVISSRSRSNRASSSSESAPSSVSIASRSGWMSSANSALVSIWPRFVSPKASASAAGPAQSMRNNGSGGRKRSASCEASVDSGNSRQAARRTTDRFMAGSGLLEVDEHAVERDEHEVLAAVAVDVGRGEQPGLPRLAALLGQPEHGERESAFEVVPGADEDLHAMDLVVEQREIRGAVGVEVGGDELVVAGRVGRRLVGGLLLEHPSRPEAYAIDAGAGQDDEL